MLPSILSEFALRYPGVHVTARLVPRADMERDLLNARAYKISRQPYLNET
ncbi:MAG: hypothetical protein WBW99_16100 [Pseudolabrys sp.]